MQVALVFRFSFVPRCDQHGVVRLLNVFSSGSHSSGQSVTWTGVLNARRKVLGVKLNWSPSPPPSFRSLCSLLGLSPFIYVSLSISVSPSLSGVYPCFAAATVLILFSF